MKSFVSKVKVFSSLAVLAMALIACGIGGGGDTGRLSMSLTDKPTDVFKSVFVTIKEIYVHAENDPEDSWTKVLDVNQTFDLLTLGGGVRKQLGIVDLAAGHYTQMRLIIGMDAIGEHPFANYVIDENEDVHEMKVPSGYQTGVKLVQGFDINENSTTELIFDFDASRSVVVRGNSGKYLLKPTIHAIDDSQERMNISGKVTAAAGDPPPALAGADVSLQVYNQSAVDPKDKISVVGTTLTDSEGAYLYFFLNVPDPTTFNLVATHWAATDKVYAPDWGQIPNAQNGNAYTVDFALAVPAEVGTLGLKAIVADADTDKNPDPETIVTISIRQLSDLDGAPPVEVKSIDIVGYDDEYVFTEITAIDVKLSVGTTYTVVASTPNRTTLEQSITIAAGANALEFTFPVPPPTR